VETKRLKVYILKTTKPKILGLKVVKLKAAK
jgi:hypothetical protein